MVYGNPSKELASKSAVPLGKLYTHKVKNLSTFCICGSSDNQKLGERSIVEI